MAYTTIDNPTDYFNTVLYTGNETARDITTGLTSTDWVWIKRRDGTANHRIFDVVRGVHENLQSNTSNAEQNNTQSLTAFGTSTFSLGTDSGGYDVNTNSQTYVSWNWSAGGSASSNSNGSITSSVSANTTSGFSIVSYTGTGSNATVGHGLGAVPQTVIVKRRSGSSESWMSYHEPLGNTGRLGFNFDDGVANDSSYWNSTTPTSSVFSIGTNGSTNASSETYIAYCFAEKKGYSKFGSYTGNGNSDGTFVYTGFKPAFVITKRTTDGNESWHIFDNKRNTFNEVNTRIQGNSSGGEDTAAPLGDFVSNGFKIRGTGGGINVSGKNFIYIAFAESPFVSSGGIPTTAR